jgi:hypothetical protein
VALFRRRHETLNEQLMREAGLDPAQASVAPAAPSGSAPFPVVGDIHLGWRGRVGSGPPSWDAIVTVTAPALSGDEVAFTTLPYGDVIVDEEEGDADLSSVADALEKKIGPPYKAVGARHADDLWVVGAKRIKVAEIALAEGDAIELTRNDGSLEVRVDGEPSNVQVPELEQLGEQEGPNYCVEAERIDGDLWEVEASAL